MAWTSGVTLTTREEYAQVKDTHGTSPPRGHRAPCPMAACRGLYPAPPAVRLGGPGSETGAARSGTEGPPSAVRCCAHAPPEDPPQAPTPGPRPHPQAPRPSRRPSRRPVPPRAPPRALGLTQRAHGSMTAGGGGALPLPAPGPPSLSAPLLCFSRLPFTFSVHTSWCTQPLRLRCVTLLGGPEWVGPLRR